MSFYVHPSVRPSVCFLKLALSTDTALNRYGLSRPRIDHFSFLYVIIVTYGSTYLNIIRIPWGQYISFFRWEGGGLLQFLTQWFYFLYKYHDDITSISHTQRPWSIKTSLAKGSWTEVLSESSSRSLCPTYTMAISSQIISDLYSSHWLLYHQTITNVV